MALISVFHDVYAKDISRKICSLFEVKKKNGDFRGWLAPYGYVKSASDRNTIVIDEQCAAVVRRIFSICFDKLTVDIIVNFSHPLSQCAIIGSAPISTRPDVLERLAFFANKRLAFVLSKT